MRGGQYQERQVDRGDGTTTRQLASLLPGDIFLTNNRQHALSLITMHELSRDIVVVHVSHDSPQGQIATIERLRGLSPGRWIEVDHWIKVWPELDDLVTRSNGRAP